MEATIQFNLPKPVFGAPCNGCGYCCSVQPCQLAQEFLNSHTGPCVALEKRDGRAVCGLVRNPLSYIFAAAHPDQEVPVLDEALDCDAGRQLSSDLAAALGVGKGCDADDDSDSEAWTRKSLSA